AETVEDVVRVSIVRIGGVDAVSVMGGGSSSQQGCVWTVVFAPALDDAAYGISPGAKPDPDARFALLLCNGSIVRPIWVSPADVVDVDGVARGEVERFVREVLAPAVSIGVNPQAKGLAGLRSWFWIDGFSGSVSAPPISAFGLTIDVRMSLRHVTWEFGDGTVEVGDLGRAYPEESTVRHAYRNAGSYAVNAAIVLIPEYRVDGGSWLTLADITAPAATTHDVEQRQPVVTDA
ncbi:MAG: hypothetical protein WD691_07525, partial [Acidimicrobiales bacterium]